MHENGDVEGLTRLLAMAGSDPEGTAHMILDSEWLVRHEFRVVRSFLTGCLRGIPND